MVRVPPPVLTEDEINAALADLAGWEIKDGKLHKEFVFGNFVEAFGFMTQAALEAEKADHTRARRAGRARAHAAG